MQGCQIARYGGKSQGHVVSALAAEAACGAGMHLLSTWQEQEPRGGGLCPRFPGTLKDSYGPERWQENNTEALCLIPCAIDQDPYFRMTRDVAVSNLSQSDLIQPNLALLPDDSRGGAGRFGFRKPAVG